MGESAKDETKFKETLGRMLKTPPQSKAEKGKRKPHGQKTHKSERKDR